MRKFISFLLLGLLLSVGNVWALTKTEGFETADASTTYNSTKTYDASKSDCGISWTMYYGTASTNDKISGNNSAQMRWYSSSTSNIPYVKTTTPIDGLSNVALKARTSNLDVKMDVCYSTNGTTWTVGKTHTFTATGTGENVSLDIPSGSKYVKFEVSSSSTAPSSGSYKLIVDDVVFTYTSSLVPATWSLAPTSASVVQGENTTMQLTTNYDGTLTFTSNNTDVATVTYNASTKVISIVGVGAGNTTITATGSATATYEAISKNIEVTVTYPEFESNVMDAMEPLGYSYFGLTGDKGTSPNEYAQPSEESREKTDACGVTLLLEKGESSTNVRYDASYMRWYNKNTLTVTAPTGSTISKIVFAEPSSGAAWAGSMTADKGTYVSSIKTWFATANDVTSVELLNDNTKRIGGIEVYLKMSSDTRTLGANGYSTYAAPFKCTISGATVYKAAYNGSNAVVLTEVTNAVVPEGEGIILKGTEGATVTISPSSAAASDFTGNALVGVLAAKKAVANTYVLSTNDGTTAFNPCDAGVLIPALKAYMIISGSSAPDAIRIIEETTDIKSVEASEKAVKFIENGQLLIMREGITYDALGRVVR